LKKTGGQTHSQLWPLAKKNDANHYTASKCAVSFMGALIDWISQPSTAGSLLLVAMPGVGDVGKLAIDAVNTELDAEPVARILHPALPPLAKLDDDGLLVPPHILLSRVRIDDRDVFTLTGDAQPMTPEGQFEMATAVLELFEGGEALVLAGMSAQADRKDIFTITSSSSYRIELESMGVDVRRDEPAAGVIGMAALITALGPVKDVKTSCTIATTVGNSADPVAAQLLLETVRRWWSLPLPVPIDATQRLADKLKEMHPEKAEDMISELSESPDSIYM
jgi:proteasome assembly chaperone (PAC2) family protein